MNQVAELYSWHLLPYLADEPADYFLMSRRTLLALSLVVTATIAAAPALATGDQAVDATGSTAPKATGSASATPASSVISTPSSSGSAASSSTSANGGETSSSTSAGTGSSTSAADGGSSSTVSGSSTSVGAASSTTKATGTLGTTTSTTIKVAAAGAANTTTTLPAITIPAVAKTIEPDKVLPKGIPATPVGGWPIRPMVFPVLGPTPYSGGWGDYRADIATNFHIGVDMIGVKLQPLVATVNGTITHTVNNHVTAGWGLVITDDEGWDYRYYHMNNDKPGTDDASNPEGWRYAPGLSVGSRVVAGQLIGYMGDSGDSEATSHLHFEIHRPDGSPIDPFPSVRAAELPTRCNPPSGLGELPNFSPPTDTDAEVVEVTPLSGIGSFLVSANGTVFRVGSARDIGWARYNKADGECPQIGSSPTTTRR